MMTKFRAKHDQKTWRFLIVCVIYILIATLSGAVQGATRPELPPRANFIFPYNELHPALRGAVFGENNSMFDSYSSISTNKVDSNIFLNAALNYAAKNIPVYPGYSRKPYIGSEACPKCLCGLEPYLYRPDIDPIMLCPVCRGEGGEKPYDQATTDPETIAKWWTKWPEAQILVPTGSKSGIFGLDVDNKVLDLGNSSLAELEKEYGPLPKTPCVKTPSNGFHIWFAYPSGTYLRNTNGKLGDGLETKGERGQIIAPPSILRVNRGSGNWERCSYEWVEGTKDLPLAPVPDWMVELLAVKERDYTRTTAPLPASLDEYAARRVGKYVERAVEGIVEEMASAQESTRNDTLNKCFFRLASLRAAGALTDDEADRAMEALKSAAASVGLEHKEIERTARSGWEAGLLQPANLPDFSAPMNLVRLQEPSPTSVSNVSGTASAVTGADAPAQVVPAPQINSSKVNDDVLAEVYVSMYPDTMYCKELGKAFEWTPDLNVWAEDKTDLFHHKARMIVRQFNFKGDKGLAKAATCKSVLTHVFADPRIAVLEKDLDSEPMLLNTPGGCIWLDGRPDDGIPDKDRLCTQSTLVPVETGDPEVFLECMHQWTHGDPELIRHMQQMAGYALTGDTREQSLTFITGSGGNGKSVWLNVLEDILDSYAQRATLDLLTDNKGMSGHTCSIAMLHNARLVTVSETEEGRNMKETFVKALTGGDRITARFMRENDFTFTPKFKIFIVSNSVPNIRKVDDAMRRRINIIPFDYKPPKPNKELPVLLRKEYGRILNWMILGCQDWLKNGMTKPKVMINATQAYFDEQDLLMRWFQHDCEIANGDATGASELYRSWREFMQGVGENERFLNQKRFGGEMSRVMVSMGITKKSTRDGIIYENVRLR